MRYAVTVIGQNVVIDCGTHEEAMNVIDRVSLDAPVPPLDVERLARALAVVFSYHELNARMDSRGSSTLNGEGTSYWRDRAEAVLAALQPTKGDPEAGR